MVEKRLNILNKERAIYWLKIINNLLFIYSALYLWIVVFKDFLNVSLKKDTVFYLIPILIFILISYLLNNIINKSQKIKTKKNFFYWLKLITNILFSISVLFFSGFYNNILNNLGIAISPLINFIIVYYILEKVHNPIITIIIMIPMWVNIIMFIFSFLIFAL